jgi:hypothetical protein
MKKCEHCGKEMKKHKKYDVVRVKKGLPDEGKPIFRKLVGETWKCYGCGRQEDA